MTPLSIVFDENRCIGCKACEVHCSQWNGLPMSLCRLLGGSPRQEPDGMRLAANLLRCAHCLKPQCLKACGRGAMQRDEDGVVHIDAARCDGCGDCLRACPYQALRRHPVTGKMHKCDLCAGRRRVGEEPACVAGCLTRALRLSDTEDDYRRAVKSIALCRRQL